LVFLLFFSLVFCRYFINWQWRSRRIYMVNCSICKYTLHERVKFIVDQISGNGEGSVITALGGSAGINSASGGGSGGRISISSIPSNIGV
jgi:hypothetical protein